MQVSGGVEIEEVDAFIGGLGQTLTPFTASQEEPVITA